MTDDGMSDVLAALSSPVRRRMVDALQARPGTRLSELAGRFEMSRIGVMKHLAVLEHAGLVISERTGRERRLYFNFAPIQLIYDRWTDRYAGFWGAEVSDIKRRAESRARGRAVKCA